MTEEAEQSQPSESAVMALMMSPSFEAMPKIGAKVVGVIALVAGGLLALFSFTMETSAPFSDTLNMGLLQTQLMVLQLGLALFVGGAVLTGCGAILDELRKARAGEEV